MNARTRRAGFTLVELLIVIAIVAVMMLLTVPAFLDIGRGSRMQAAVNQLNTTISLARQWAITKRENVYLVFPDDFSALYNGSTNHIHKALRAYAAYVPGKGYITEWRFLPNGIYFVDSYNTPNINNKHGTNIQPNNNLFRQQTLQQLPFPTASSGNEAINAIQFKPDGTVSASGIAPIEIYLAEGAALDGLAGKVVNLVWKENPALRGLVVNRWFHLEFEKPDYPAVQAYYDRLSERSAYRAYVRNGMP